MLEGLAGFGLPIAIVAPMLVALDVAPITAIAAVAVGHAWSVTFGDMGVIFQALTGVVHVDGAVLAPPTAFMLGVACLACGLGAALILGFNPLVLIAAQTTGGSLGGMIAPAKLIVGCSTLGLKGGDGEVLRRTLPYDLVIGLALGVLALVLTR